MSDKRNITEVKASGELETRVLSGPRGQFRLMVDDPSVAGMPFVVFAGPVAKGLGQVTPELPKEWRADDQMFMAVETASKEIPVPAGWIDHGWYSLYAVATINDSEVRYMSVFYRRAYSNEIPPTITAPGERILAQILACRPQEPPE